MWERAEGLDVPLYLHPANGVDTPHVLNGHPELTGPMWSWGNETASHFLRLVFGGVFDDFPDAKLLLGHMGEGLPYVLWRLDSRWGFHNHHGVELARGNPSEYVRHNLYITTSGVCSAPPAAVRAARTRPRAHPLRDRLPLRGDGDSHRVPAQRTDQRGGPRQDRPPQRRTAAASVTPPPSSSLHPPRSTRHRIEGKSST
ncbi:hypothetical protein GCM10020295_75420 [Streptomyces cinereospinus]